MAQQDQLPSFYQPYATSELPHAPQLTKTDEFTDQRGERRKLCTRVVQDNEKNKENGTVDLYWTSHNPFVHHVRPSAKPTGRGPGFVSLPRRTLPPRVPLHPVVRDVKKVQPSVTANSISTPKANGIGVAMKAEAKEVKEAKVNSDSAEEVETLKTELAQLATTLQGLQERKKRVDARIKVLHDYNEIKDVVQGLMGQLAQLEGLTTKDMYVRFDLDLED